MAITAVLIAAAPDGGGLPPAVYAERALLQLPDAGWAPSACFAGADGGTDCSGGWLPLPHLEDYAGERMRLLVENAQLKATPPLFSPQTWGFFGLLLTLAGLASIVAGFELGTWLPRK